MLVKGVSSVEKWCKTIYKLRMYSNEQVRVLYMIYTWKTIELNEKGLFLWTNLCLSQET